MRTLAASFHLRTAPVLKPRFQLGTLASFTLTWMLLLRALYVQQVTDQQAGHTTRRAHTQRAAKPT